MLQHQSNTLLDCYSILSWFYLHKECVCVLCVHVCVHISVCVHTHVFLCVYTCVEMSFPGPVYIEVRCSCHSPTPTLHFEAKSLTELGALCFRMAEWPVILQDQPNSNSVELPEFWTHALLDVHTASTLALSCPSCLIPKDSDEIFSR